MTDKKISELTSITGANVNDTTDELAIVDASTNTTKAITREELFQDVLKIKVGGGADGGANADELVASKDQTNVGISILSEDSTGFSRLLFGTQTDTSAAKVQYIASSDEIILQSGGIVTLQSGGTNDRVTIDSSGNVGIGNSSPSAPLDVTGTVKSTVSSTGDFNFDAISSGGGNYRIYPDDATTANPTWLHQSNSSEDQAWVIGGVERMRIDSSGNLGIGTTSPATKLHVQDADNALGIKTGTLFVEDTEASVEINSASGGDCFIYFTDGNTNATSGGSIKYAEPGGAGEHMAMFTGGTERMRIDDTGLGIGTTSPAQALDVTGNAAVSGKAKVGTGADASSNGDEFVISKDQTNVGMSVLTADGTGFARIFLGSQTDTQAASVRHSENNDRLFVQAKGDLYFQTGGTNTKMTLDSSGNVGFGTASTLQGATTATSGLWYDVDPGYIASTSNNDVALILNRTGASDGQIASFRRSGSPVGSISVTGSATAYNTSSDYRLKEDWQPMTGASDRVLTLNPVNFAWKADGTRVDGFLAHEAQAVVPEAVIGEKDGEEMQGMDHSKLVPLLTAALQEALKRIEALEAQVNP